MISILAVDKNMGIGVGGSDGGFREMTLGVERLQSQKWR